MPAYAASDPGWAKPKPYLQAIESVVAGTKERYARARVIVHRMVNNVDESFRALSHPIRLEIVERLARGPATVGVASAGLDVSKPAVTKHLKVLESAGLVTRAVEGRTHVLRLAPSPLEQAGGWIERQRRLWESKFDTIEAYLEEETGR